MKNLRFFLLSLVLLLTGFSSYSQVGLNNPNPDSSSILDLKANDKGLLVPRMTTIDRTNMTVGGKTPANSLLVFDTDLQVFFFYDTVSVPSRWLSMNPWVSQGKSNSDIITATSGNVGIGTTSAPSAKLEVNGSLKTSGTITAPNYALNAVGNGPIPQGGIIMWSGNPSAIPVGWALCDGNNGTPNLSGRFIASYDKNDADYNNTNKVGPSYTDADGTSTGNNTQDAKKIRLTATQSGLPAHNHTLNDPGHSHPYSDNYAPQSGNTNGGSGHRPIDWNADQNRTTTPSVTGITIQGSTPQDASQAIENRPSYYVLAFIMKL